MALAQTTLSCATPWLKGLHLDQDAAAGVRFCPAAEDTGIVFVRADLPGDPEVRCVLDNLRSMPRWTSLAEGGHWVHHTEHVLAALAFCRIDNARVEMDCDRLPMMPGGSCAPFVEAILCAGVRQQDAPRQVFTLQKPFVHLDNQTTTGEQLEEPSIRNGRYILGFPSDRLKVSSIFHWPQLESLPVGIAEFEMSDEGVDDEVVQSRSYLVDSEREQVRDLLGPIRDHVLHLSPGCSTDLAIEAARHKIVDFVGDMMVLGRPLVGHFAIFRAGHRIHHDVARQLYCEGIHSGRSGLQVCEK